MTDHHELNISNRQIIARNHQVRKFLFLIPPPLQTLFSEHIDRFQYLQSSDSLDTDTPHPTPTPLLQ